MNIYDASLISSELKEILNDLHRKSFNLGFKMNRNKIKIIFKFKVPKKIKRIEDEDLEDVHDYICLEKVLTLNEDHGN